MSNHICPKCETAVIAAWRQEIDGNYYHDRCLPFRGLLNQAESELTTLRQRAERAEAELEECKWKLGNATGNYLTLLAEPCIVCNQKQYEAEAAQSTIAELNATVERTDKERIELAKMLLHYVRSVPLGNQPHMSAEIAEKMALVALGES